MVVWRGVHGGCGVFFETCIRTKTVQSVRLKQACKTRSVSLVHLLTVLNTGLADLSFCL